MKTYIKRINGLIGALDSLLVNLPDDLTPLVATTQLNSEQARAYNNYVLSANPSQVSGMMNFNSPLLRLNDRLIFANKALELIWAECRYALMNLEPRTDLAAQHIRRVVLLKHGLLILQDFACSMREGLDRGVRGLYSVFEEELAQSIESLTKKVLQDAAQPPAYQATEESGKTQRRSRFFRKKSPKATSVYRLRLDELPSYETVIPDSDPPAYCSAEIQTEDDHEASMSVATQVSSTLSR